MTNPRLHRSLEPSLLFLLEVNPPPPSPPSGQSAPSPCSPTPSRRRTAWRAPPVTNPRLHRSLEPSLLFLLEVNSPPPPPPPNLFQRIGMPQVIGLGINVESIDSMLSWC